MDYFFDPYTKPIQIDNDEFTFKKLSEISPADKEELTKIYCTLFNQDNKIVLTELGIKGKSTDSGVWDEEPYSLSTCRFLLDDYATDKYFGVCAYGTINNKKIPVGACIYQLRDLGNLKSKGYEIPFDIPNNIEFWCATDTFRVELTVNGSLIRGLAKKMRDKVKDFYKKQWPVLEYGSTNNPVMVKSWRKHGFVIVEKETTFGNRFQAFKMS
jgi:hypothetical protein